MKKIKLTKGHFAIVDDEDFERLNEYSWHADDSSYPRAKGWMRGSTKVYMHRIILNAPSNLDVDHINHNTLDNRRCNLRLATVSQNIANSIKRGYIKGKPCSSKFKGVSWSKKHRKWKAEGTLNNKYFFLGRYAIEEDAAYAYDDWAKKSFGEFANLNFS